MSKKTLEELVFHDDFMFAAVMMDAENYTRSIMAFCEKHNAFYDFSTEGGWFKLMITL